MATRYPRRRTDHRWWTGLAVFLGLVFVALVIQGLTVHKIGFGPLSIEFGEKAKSGGGTNGGGNGAPADVLFDQAKTITGSWKTTKGKVTLEVVQVEQQDDWVRVTARVRNGGGNAVNLPLFGNFVASDDTDTAYSARITSMNTGWTPDVPAGQTLRGVIVLDKQVPPSAKALTVSFTHVLGFGAPSGGITVSGVPVPR
ncbi:hypothetical protein [Actinokineospora sp.]|uniref:hypothetical protein n=1 Tax=Actinokineospora sp. TaxID=1872133 RepID=UPI003D6C171D